jgi:alpha-ketoglutarate-dependent taurine dioxygenase
VAGEIRWRFDNLEIDEELRAMAARFRDHIEGHRKVAEFTLRSDSVLICDNRRILHGRTTFTDIDRLLLRVRLEQR